MSSDDDSMLRSLKNVLRNRLPAAVAAYHSFRTARSIYGAKPQMCELGFRFAGPAEMLSGAFEKEEASVILEQTGHADVFIDIGANVGYYTCLARHRQRHVVAIEPFPQNLDQLYANLYANEWSDVEVFPLAVGRTSGLSHMFGGGTAASLRRGWAGASEAWRTPVPLSTLDIVLGDRFPDKRLFIKIDVEGGELEVLLGASQTLRRTPSPVWFVEICLTENQPTGLNDHFADVFKQFWTHGYAARTGDASRCVVTPELVDRWVNQRKRDFGYVSYIFERCET
jgi:FkbM family methyltransferase